MTKLADQHCVPCHGGVPPLKGDQLVTYSAQLPDWNIVAEHHLAKTFLFSDFRTALDFVNRAGAIAEQEGHHPNLCLAWGKVEVMIYTHKVRGLTENDFVLAAKMNQEYLAGPR